MSTTILKSMLMSFINKDEQAAHDQLHSYLQAKMQTLTRLGEAQSFLSQAKSLGLSTASEERRKSKIDPKLWYISKGNRPIGQGYKTQTEASGKAREMANNDKKYKSVEVIKGSSLKEAVELDEADVKLDIPRYVEDLKAHFENRGEYPEDDEAEEEIEEYLKDQGLSKKQIQDIWQEVYDGIQGD